jgi:predicted RNA binding protein YcfA (HicA-like mRNA interferase family)
LEVLFFGFLIFSWVRLPGIAYHIGKRVWSRSRLTRFGWKWDAGCRIVSHVPRKIRQLVSDLEAAGFVLVKGGKGSHRKFVHSKFQGFVLLSGKDGDDALHYQEKHVRRALRQVQL